MCPERCISASFEEDMRSPTVISYFRRVRIETCFDVFDAWFDASMKLGNSTAVPLMTYNDARERLRCDVLLVNDSVAANRFRYFTACVFIITIVIRRGSRASIKDRRMAAFRIRSPAAYFINGVVTWQDVRLPICVDVSII